jgi:hypothetical protein
MNPCPTCDLSNYVTGYRGQLCPIRAITPDKYRIGCSEWREKRQGIGQDDTGGANGTKDAHRQGGDATNGVQGEIEGIYPIKPDRLERQLQAQCEGWLSQRGYRRMTAPEAEAAMAPGASETRGWFAHLGKAKGNPLMPDVMLYNADMTRCLMIELKILNVYQPGQKAMVQAGAWRLAHYFETVVKMVLEWERCNEDVTPHV